MQQLYEGYLASKLQGGQQGAQQAGGGRGGRGAGGRGGWKRHRGGAGAAAADELGKGPVMRPGEAQVGRGGGPSDGRG